ncbi:MAG: M67 family metallopeptidase [Actinomycetota bacterium]
MLEITAEVRDAMLAHAIACRPLEACGLLVRPEGALVVDAFRPVTNAVESTEIFVLDPQGMLDVERAADDAGREVVGVMHSHTTTSPYPSPTDVADSDRYDPDGLYHQVVVSLRHAEPSIRSYRIRSGEVSEERVIVVEDEPVIHDGAGAIAAVMSLPRLPKD